MDSPLSRARRNLLQNAGKAAAVLAGAGLLPTPAQAAYPTAAFEAKTLAEVMKALGAAAPAESKDVTVTAPDIADNGALVPIGVATTLAGVRRMLVVVEKNPAVLSAIFDVGQAIDANFSMRVKMGQSSHVYAVALLGDGRALYARKDVKVTLGGCGG